MKKLADIIIKELYLEGLGDVQEEYIQEKLAEVELLVNSINEFGDIIAELNSEDNTMSAKIALNWYWDAKEKIDQKINDLENFSAQSPVHNVKMAAFLPSESFEFIKTELRHAIKIKDSVQEFRKRPINNKIYDEMLDHIFIGMKNWSEYIAEGLQKLGVPKYQEVDPKNFG